MTPYSSPKGQKSINSLFVMYLIIYSCFHNDWLLFSCKLQKYPLCNPVPLICIIWETEDGESVRSCSYRTFFLKIIHFPHD